MIRACLNDGKWSRGHPRCKGFICWQRMCRDTRKFQAGRNEETGLTRGLTTFPSGEPKTHKEWTRGSSSLQGHRPSKGEREWEGVDSRELVPPGAVLMMRVAGESSGESLIVLFNRICTAPAMC